MEVGEGGERAARGEPARAVGDVGLERGADRRPVRLDRAPPVGGHQLGELRHPARRDRRAARARPPAAARRRRPSRGRGRPARAGSRGRGRARRRSRAAAAPAAGGRSPGGSPRPARRPRAARGRGRRAARAPSPPTARASRAAPGRAGRRGRPRSRTAARSRSARGRGPRARSDRRSRPDRTAAGFGRCPNRFARRAARVRKLPRRWPSPPIAHLDRAAAARSRASRRCSSPRWRGGCPRRRSGSC